MAVSRDIAARWCALAEQRLQHLSEMFETGRWRRYHSEIAFLENIQEAKRAVQTWRALATGADVAAAAASVTPAFGWSPATMPRVFPRDQQAQTVQPKAVHIAPETAVPVRLDPTPDVLADVTEAPIAPLSAPPAMASRTAPAVMAPATAATLLPQFSPPPAEIVAAPERVVEFTFSLDGLEAKYPLLRNAF
ncbi:TIGR03809 family protein [Bradyrhizobium sp. 180]|uniref:TIGR03809 family protein n=1 Tax=unclassified Bradyrhizobium TaxID=2631580 RepID=UPI001FF7B0B9|nr:TIGR03809 family protein [Bradyrhizobium sp. CW12]MCK1488929.1 TIGR03809 family protein [Bradyrhizobium sp. 180]MCK1528109.1 TIGR03809 family protein [Bradyrhizobium sp. 182]MCK1597693.1 TIGR03809 family protein [Bradyrhizobium sp. 164]MCK1619243.1 TIGR03809 family protein [Bradyrhizobium sp. 159]MCK1643256.1 TIGR03809 family protein [Bradyrhizobium sp. 154]MCK1669352.1 TIGR03809 family protein [Bradyrhizobium sp. 153]MCK1757929.1 TIGR03809 family protein [Bradyrhizobium sp. 137]